MWISSAAALCLCYSVCCVCCLLLSCSVICVHLCGLRVGVVGRSCLKAQSSQLPGPQITVMLLAALLLGLIAGAAGQTPTGVPTSPPSGLPSGGPTLASLVSSAPSTVAPSRPTSLPSGLPTGAPSIYYSSSYAYSSSSYAYAYAAPVSKNKTCQEFGHSWNPRTLPFANFPKTISNGYYCEILQRFQVMQYRNGTAITPFLEMIPNKRNTSKPVTEIVKINDFNGADPISGNVNLGIDISMTWKDDFKSWDVTTDCNDFNPNISTPCPSYNVTYIGFNQDALWLPDFQLSNDAVPFDQGFPAKQNAVVSHNGLTTFALTGQITYSCNYVLTDFR